MEPYIPLVKAIIISTVFAWGASSEVIITDKYIFVDSNSYSHDDEEIRKSYGIYDLKTNIVHVISGEMENQIVTRLQPIDPRIKSALESPEYRPTGETDTTWVKENLEEFKCRREVINIVSSTYQPEVGAKLNSYFAKIPWLDKILDTKEKREYAGFERQEYSPYHYLIYSNMEYPNQSPRDHLVRVIEKKEVDTTLLHTLLNLPLKKD